MTHESGATARLDLDRLIEKNETLRTALQRVREVLEYYNQRIGSCPVPGLDEETTGHGLRCYQDQYRQIELESEGLKIIRALREENAARRIRTDNQALAPLDTCTKRPAQWSACWVSLSFQLRWTSKSLHRLSGPDLQNPLRK